MKMRTTRRKRDRFLFCVCTCIEHTPTSPSLPNFLPPFSSHTFYSSLSCLFTLLYIVLILPPLSLLYIVTAISVCPFSPSVFCRSPALSLAPCPVSKPVISLLISVFLLCWCIILYHTEGVEREEGWRGRKGGWRERGRVRKKGTSFSSVLFFPLMTKQYWLWEREGGKESRVMRNSVLRSHNSMWKYNKIHDH